MTMWRDLTMQLRADLMQATGIFDPVRLRQEYDAYHLAKGGHMHQSKGFMDFKSPEEILAEKYGVEPVVDNANYNIPLVVVGDKIAYQNELDRRRLEDLVRQSMQRTPVISEDNVSKELRLRNRDKAEIANRMRELDEAAANFGYSIGANAPLNIDLVNLNTLGALENMAYMAGPLYGIGQSAYYLATDRPGEAALSAAMQLLPKGVEKVMSNPAINNAMSILRNNGYAKVNGNTITWNPLFGGSKGPKSDLLLHFSDGNANVASIGSVRRGDGRKLYDAAIKYVQEQGYPGLVSGKNLMSAPKTYNTYIKYYPSRKVVGKGTWLNMNMVDKFKFKDPDALVFSIEDLMQRNAIGQYAWMKDAPVYLLDQPSQNIAVINEEGPRNLANWYNQFKGVFDKAKNFRFNITKPDNYYRIVGYDAIEDAMKRGVVVGSLYYPEGPYFAKGDLFWNIAPGSYVMEATPKSNIDFINASRYRTLDPSIIKGIDNGTIDPNKYLVNLDKDILDGIEFVKDLPSDWKGIESLPWYQNSTNKTPLSKFNVYKKLPIGYYRTRLIGDPIAIPKQYGGYLDNIILGQNKHSKGGSIHIKPENRGKFTALKKRTGHSASWFKAHGTPALKKMATFALNARHWKHLNGGYLDDIIWDNMGLWNPRNYGKPTGIQGNKLGTYIVNNDDPQDLVAVDNYGNTKFIPANTRGPFYFPGSRVVEYPMSHLSHKAQDGKKLIITPEQELQAKMRYLGYFNAMVNNGINPVYARDAAYYATLQSFAEAGWKPNKHNNYGGMKNSKGLISYPSEEAYFDAWVKNANNKWPDYYKSQSIQDWDEALNHTSLGLFDKDLFYKYLKKNPDTYIYAPAWENDSYLNKMLGVKNRMDGALGVYPNDVFLEYIYNQDPLNQRIESNQVAQTYQYGGLTKPFSYANIPVVRYGFGGYSYI